MSKMATIRLSQSWQVPQKPDRTGKTYPPIVETLSIEVENVPLHELGSTYTQLNTELFNARISHMKGLKQRSAVDGFMKDSGF